LRLVLWVGLCFCLLTFCLQLLSQVDWSDFDVSGQQANRLSGSYKTQLGRVVEESVVSYKTMGLTALSLVAVGAGLAFRNSARLRLR